VPADYGYFFVRPGVRQRLSFVTPVSSDFAFVLARVTVGYERTNEVHTAERAFEVSARSG
jgi:hypothetical protein